MLDVEEQLRRYGAAVEQELSGASTPVAGPPRRRRPALLLALAAAVVMVAALVAVRDEGPSHVVTQPTGVFAEATGVVLLVPDGIDGVTAIDPDNRIAARRVVDGERAGDQRWRINLTGGNLVLGWGEIYALPLSGGASKKIADSLVYIPAAEPGSVWVYTNDDYGNPGVRLISVTGKEQVPGQLVGAGVGPRLGVPGGLAVVTTGGVAVWDAATGTIGPVLGPGPVDSIVSNGHELAWCDGTCGAVHIAPLARTGPPTTNYAEMGQRLALSNDGQWLAFEPAAPDGNFDLVIRNLTSGRDTVAATGLTEYGAGFQWSADSRQLLLAANSVGGQTRLGRYSVDKGSWEEHEVGIGAGGHGVVVLPTRDARTFFSTKPGPANQCPGPGSTYPSGGRALCTYRF